MALGTPNSDVKGEVSRWSLGTMALLMVFVVVLGLYIPPQRYEMIMKVVEVLR